MNHYKSSLKAFYELISALEKLPTIGKKSAHKMAYALCMENKFLGLNIAHAIENAALVVQRCQKCFCISENEICEICATSERENGELCIVASPQDVLTIEEMGEFNGRYFVLSGELEHIDFTLLNKRIQSESIREVIFALSPSLANEAIMLYVEDKIHSPVHFSKIAQGVPTGIGLDSIDQLSLSRAISARVKI
ncbi:recombination mediator RecR [Helicobacter japonicus]|uniref:Recombination protein RecR n=1 Tax=Helicobacter japonicus TaxID=425400 RepID=A0A4U8TVZ5_9HELI|nr:recombination mediator RecR [Helicobacter japonicus]TLE03268.1 recombination protein RecR [Helicobacter japonicus]